MNTSVRLEYQKYQQIMVKGEPCDSMYVSFSILNEHKCENILQQTKCNRHSFLVNYCYFISLLKLLGSNCTLQKY